MSDNSNGPIRLDDYTIDRIIRGRGGSSGGNSSPSSSSSSIGSIIPDSMFGGATSAIKKFASVTDKTMDEWRESASKGISFNNNAFGLSASITQSRMSFEEFTDAADYAKNGFISIGGTMTDSAKLFLKVSTSLSDYDGDKLKMMGIQQGEYNKLLAMTMASQRNLNFEKAEDQAKARQAVLDMATEMDKVAKLTGMSRKEQEKVLEENKRDQKFQSEMRLLRKQGVNTQQIEDQAKLATTSGTGDLFKQMMAGGKLSDESNTILQLMGGDLAERYKQTVDAMKSSNPAIAKKAAEDFGKINAEAQSVFLSDANNKYSAEIDNKQTEVLRKVQQASEEFGGAGITSAMEKKGVTAQEAYSTSEQIAKNDREGKERSGKIVAGSLTTEAINKIEARVSDLRKKQGELIDAGNIAMARQLESSGALGKLRELSEPDKTGKPFADSVGGFGEAIDSITKNLTEGKFVENIGENISKIFEKGMGGVTTLVSNATEIALNATNVKINSGGNELIPVPGGDKKPTKLAEGSKATFGGYFNTPKDLLAVLSDGGQPEAVVPKDEELDFAMETISNMIGNVSSMSNKSNDKKQANDRFKLQLAKLQSADLSKEMDSISQPTEFKPDENKQQAFESGTVSLKDLKEELTKLNTSVVKLISYTSEMVDTSSKQYRATKGLSPNLNTR